MGFLDKVKGTAKQAVNPGGQMKERDKIQKINAAGVDATATVDSMQEVGSQLGGGHQIDFQLTVHPAEGADYQAVTSQSMHEQTLKGVAEGATVAVKIDPDDPQSLLVWGAAG
ncbi:MAG: hypothetical protein JSS97_03340 [Actinobacteria bacterium]|nr:hypothetical protein [Actinomycetota bacterium]